MLNRLWVFLCLMIFTFGANAQRISDLKDSLPDISPYFDYDDAKMAESQLIIVVGNDSFSLNRTDRHMTSRIQLGRIVRQIPKKYQHFIDSDRYLITTLTQDIFTPEDIGETELIEDDRPYAGWLYLTLGTVVQKKDTLTVKTVDLGIVGPSAQAELAQTEVHEAFDGRTPRGWDHQLPDELGVVFNWKRYETLRWQLSQKIVSELVTFYGAKVGNVHTQLEAGAVYRFGLGVPENFGTRFNLQTKARFRTFFYVKVKGEYVLRNIFLDGSTFKDSHSVEKKNLIGEIAAGFHIEKGPVGASIEQRWRSEDFEQQEGENTFAELMLLFRYDLK